MTYLITPTLYNSWNWFINSEQPKEEFLDFLNKKPFEPTEAILKGIKFEDAVHELTYSQTTAKVEEEELETAKQIADMVKGGIWQVSLSKKVDNYVLYGKADVIKGNTIHDIKRVGTYDLGKYQDSIQHLIYMECADIPNFNYDISDGKNVYVETYHKEKDNLTKIISMVNGMVNWLKATPEFWVAFDTNWKSKF